MVDLNATIFVQAFHFLVAWYLLDTFLLKKVVRIIQKELAATSKVVNAIDKSKRHLEAEQRKQDLIWIQHRKQFQMFAPAVEMSPLLSFSALLCPVSMDMKSEERKKLLNDTKSFLKEKVMHV